MCKPTSSELHRRLRAKKRGVIFEGLGGVTPYPPPPKGGPGLIYGGKPPPGPRARTAFRAGARYGPHSTPGVPARSRTISERGGCGRGGPRVGPPPPRPVPPAAPSQNGPPPGPRARTVFRAGARYGPLSAPGVPARSRTTRERGGCGQESPRVGPPPPGPGPPAAPAQNGAPPGPRARTAFRAGAQYGPLPAPGDPARSRTTRERVG